MAQLPSLISSARRTLIPSTDLRVTGVSPAAFGGAVGEGLQQLGEGGTQAAAALQHFALAKQQEEERLAEFDRQTQFIAFSARQSEQLAVAARELSGPAQDFTKAIAARFDQDAAAFLEKVPARHRPDWQARMAQLRSGVSNQALRAEFGQRDAYYRTTIDGALDHLANGASSAPDRLPDFRAQGEAAIQASGLSAQEKAERTAAWRAQAALAAASGDVMRDPGGALQRLGGVDHFTKLEAVGRVPAGSAQAEAIFGALITQESGGRPGVAGPQTQYGRAYGLTQVLDSTGAEMAKKLGISWRPELMRAKTPEAAEYQRMIGRAYFDEGLAAYGGDVRKALMRYHGGPDEAKWGPKTRAYASAVLARVGGAPVQTATAGPAPGTASDSPSPEGVLDDRYADLPFNVRQQLIGQAQREIDRRQAVTAAAREQQHNAWLNSFFNDLNDGKAGLADIHAARESGVLTDFDEINRAQTIVEQREKERGDLSFYNSAIATPGFVWNRYDPTQKQAVDAAVKAQGGSMEAAFGIWQKTGILGKEGAIMLRGALVSADPTRLRQAANIAGNMLRRNPNAFAGIDGGDEIEEAALAFNHYTYNMGRSPEEAAAIIATENSPEFKSKVKLGQPEIDDLRKSLRKEGGRAADIVFDGAQFISPSVARAANDAYAEMVVSYVRRGRNESTARGIAAQQLLRVYGPNRYGRIMQYPPEKGYPALQGPTTVDPYRYIYDDAVATVKEHTGLDVLRRNLIFVPIPRVTDEDFRNGRPPRYKLLFGHKVDGQLVYDALPGRFQVDVATEQAKVSAERGALFERAANSFSLADMKERYPKRQGESGLAYQMRLDTMRREHEGERLRNLPPAPVRETASFAGLSKANPRRKGESNFDYYVRINEMMAESYRE